MLLRNIKDVVEQVLEPAGISVHLAGMKEIVSVGSFSVIL
jgi:hypothetical protein